MQGKVYTQHDGGLWAQPDGPNTAVTYQGCHDVDDIDEPLGDVDLIFCIDASQNFVPVGESRKPPDPVKLTISTLSTMQLDFLESYNCPMGLYILQRSCGKADAFTSYDRGFVLQSARVTGRKLGSSVHHVDDKEVMNSADLTAYPNIIRFFPAKGVRVADALTTELCDIYFYNQTRCWNDCGSSDRVCKSGLLANYGGAAAKVFPQNITNYGTIANTATQPGAVGATEAGISVSAFYLTKTIVRKLVARMGVAGSQGVVYRTDDDGTTWVTVNVGGAAAGHGAMDSGGLFVYDQFRIWLASNLGYIYFSSDGGVSYAAQEAGAIHVGAYNAINFVDEKHGIAVGAAGVTALTIDGGATWFAGGVVTGAPALTSVCMCDANIIWVGTATGLLFYSLDGGLTWANRAGWTGSGVGDVADISFINPYVGFMVSNTAAPVGTLFRTVNGGWTWEAITTPTNSGLNAVHVCDVNNAWVVGKVNAATGFVAKFTAAQA